MHERQVAYVQLVVAGRHRPVPLEPVDAALHRVALAVVEPAEPRRPATQGAAPLAVADLVVGLGDGATDPTPAQRIENRQSILVGRTLLSDIS